MAKVECPYCGGQAMLVSGSYLYPRRTDLHNKHFWSCEPCKAYVGCHEKRYSHEFEKGTMPLGRLANAELRSAKSAAHALFDPVWRTGKIGRGEAYAWLAEQMGIPMEECHIGMFDVDKCKQVFAIMRSANTSKQLFTNRLLPGIINALSTTAEDSIMATAKKVFKFPKEIGKCADMLYQLREKRLAGQKLVDAVEAEEKALKEHIINTLPKSEAAGVTGAIARVTVVTKQVPQVKDWDAFYKFIKKTDGFDLLNRALNKTAVEARYEAGKKVPGVEDFPVVSVSCVKA